MFAEVLMSQYYFVLIDRFLFMNWMTQELLPFRSVLINLDYVLSAHSLTINLSIHFSKQAIMNENQISNAQQ